MIHAAPAPICGQHSNRISKQQKIKNIGVLDKKMETATNGFGKSEDTAFREIYEMLVKSGAISRRSFCFSEVNEPDPIEWTEQISRVLDRCMAFREKPYPHLHTICALDHPAAPQFLKRKSPSQRSRWRRSAGVLFSKNFEEQGDVYRSSIGEVWEALIGNTDLHTLYFSQARRFRGELQLGDAVWAHLNLAAFIDPLTQKFRWADLRAGVRTLHQLLLPWKGSTKPEIDTHRGFRVGFCGWGSALLKLGLKYESDMSSLLAKRLSIKLAQVADSNAVDD